MLRVAKSIENHMKGTLAHWQQGLTTAYLEGLNGVFSAVKRKARTFTRAFPQPAESGSPSPDDGWRNLPNVVFRPDQ
ncbi:MAG: transposase [Verrucomicrobiia bacterium]